MDSFVLGTILMTISWLTPTHHEGETKTLPFNMEEFCKANECEYQQLNVRMIDLNCTSELTWFPLINLCYTKL